MAGRNAGGSGRVKTEVKSCSCLHPFQDEKYGKGKRLHRVTDKGEAQCTVCTPIRARKRLNMYLEGRGNATGRMG